MTANGRTQLRGDQAKSYCQGCSIRITVGEPKATPHWYQRLRLTREQVDYLLEAAAEFDELAAEYEDHPSAVEFVDWVSVDALRTGKVEPPFWDGAPPRYDSGEVARKGDRTAHRHPDPIPFGGRLR